MGDIKPMQVLPGLIRNAREFGVTLPREFLLIIKQLLYFDRYARLGAPNLNVFTDLHLIDFLFTPAAAEAGIDLQDLMMRIPAMQARLQKPETRPVAKKSAVEKPVERSVDELWTN